MVDNLPILGPFVETRRCSQSVTSTRSNDPPPVTLRSPLPSISEDFDLSSSDSSFSPSSTEESEDSSVGSEIPAPLSLPDLVSIDESEEFGPHIDLRFDSSRSPSVAETAPLFGTECSPPPFHHESVPLNPENFPRHWDWLDGVEHPCIERVADDIILSVNRSLPHSPISVDEEYLSIDRTFPRGSTPAFQGIIQPAEFGQSVEEPVNNNSSPMSVAESTSHSSIKYALDMPEGTPTPHSIMLWEEGAMHYFCLAHTKLKSQVMTILGCFSKNRKLFSWVQ